MKEIFLDDEKRVQVEWMEHCFSKLIPGAGDQG